MLVRFNMSCLEGASTGTAHLVFWAWCSKNVYRFKSISKALCRRTLLPDNLFLNAGLRLMLCLRPQEGLKYTCVEFGQPARQPIKRDGVGWLIILCFLHIQHKMLLVTKS